MASQGSVRSPGRSALNNSTSDGELTKSVKQYCRQIDLDPQFVPALYDLYNVFVKAELDEAYATQPHAKVDPFLYGLPSKRLSQVLASPSW